MLIRTHAASLRTTRYYGPSWCNESSSSFPHDIFAVPMYYPSNHNKDWPIYPTVPAGNNWTIQLATIAYALMMVRLKRPLVRHHDTHTHMCLHAHFRAHFRLGSELVTLADAGRRGAASPVRTQRHGKTAGSAGAPV